MIKCLASQCLIKLTYKFNLHSWYLFNSHILKKSPAPAYAALICFRQCPNPSTLSFDIWYLFHNGLAPYPCSVEGPTESLNHTLYPHVALVQLYLLSWIIERISPSSQTTFIQQPDLFHLNLQSKIAHSWTLYNAELSIIHFLRSGLTML